MSKTPDESNDQKEYCDISKFLKTIDNWSFEVFDLNDYTKGQALRHLGYEIMKKYDFFNKFKIPVQIMKNFFNAMEIGYSKYNNSYHNLIHATDVLQTSYNILNKSGLINWLNDLELFSTLISALIHDYEHTGTNNNFHVQTRSELALLYNDRAVLENHHVSATFRLMKDDNYNIVKELTREQFKDFRSLVIEIVLSTDMSHHFTQLKTIKNMISTNEQIEKPRALSLIVHSADIGHATKKWSLHEKWTNLMQQEFYAQGDKEKELGLPYSQFCDRNDSSVPQNQIGFINFIVEPSFTVMADMIEKIFAQIVEKQEKENKKDEKNTSFSKKKIERPWTPNLAENKSKWQEFIDDAQKKERRSASAKGPLSNENHIKSPNLSTKENSKTTDKP